MEKDCSLAGLFASGCCESCIAAQDPNRDSADVKTGKSENTQMSDAVAAK